jgi:hypothetical protein
MGRVWRTFCRHGTNLVEHYVCRGTRLIGAVNLSPVTKLVASTGAVSRYNLSGAKNLSRCRILTVGRCACPGADDITNLSWVQEQKQKV